MHRFTAPAILSLILLVSGCVFDSDKDDVKKGSVSGKITMTVTGEAVPGVKVYLVDRNAKIDTKDLSKNLTALVDSAMTDAQGGYHISGIAPGAYAVAPVNEDTTKVLKFTHAAVPDSSGFEVNGDSHTIDFIAEKKDYPGAETGYDGVITIYIHAPKNNPVSSIQVYRKNWIVFVPFWSFDGYLGYSESEGCYVSTSTYGYSWGMHTVENVWKYVVYYQSGPAAISTKEFFIGFSLADVPRVSSWDYDFSTNTLTRRETKTIAL